MQGTTEEVRSGVSADQAAHQHGVPTSALKDQLSGWILYVAKPGPHLYLGPDEEKELSEYR